MDPKAIIKARSRLRIAQKALEALPGAQNHQDYSDGWYTILVASKAVWTALEQGAKASPQARQWFAAKQQERRADELLQYMFEARNDDEHGLEEVLQYGTRTKLVSEGLHVPMDAIDLKVGFDPQTEDMIAVITHEGGSLSRVQLAPKSRHETPPRSMLGPIQPRGRPRLFPPFKHMGSSVDLTPESAATLNLTYLMRLTDDAEAFDKP